MQAHAQNNNIKKKKSNYFQGIFVGKVLSDQLINFLRNKIRHDVIEFTLFRFRTPAVECYGSGYIRVSFIHVF